MNILRGSLAVFLFECRRSMTPSRIACWLVLVLFPPAIFGLLVFYDMDLGSNAQSPISDSVARERLWISLTYATVPLVMSLLALLLWATPTVYTELEGKTWIYLAVRPSGRDVVLLGKYLAAVAWSMAAAWLGLTFTMAIIAGELSQPITVWLALSVLVVISCISYGALYCFIGVLFRRRAMAIAVSYTLIFEFLFSMVPALINKITVQHRMLSLLDTWLDMGDQLRVSGVIGDEPVWLHVCILGIYTGCLLIASSVTLRMREHITAEET